MSDNVNIPAQGTGDTTPVIAADDVGGVKYQRFKLSIGADGVANDLDAAHPVPVSDAGGSLTVDGTVAVSGTTAVSAASLPLPTGAATEASVLATATATGAQADASSANSIIGILKAIKAAITGTVAVSGTFFQATQPVSGTVTATGPVTDTQLRATPVPVSGTVTTTPPSNASTNLAQVAGASTAVGHGVAATALRVELPTDGTGVVGLAAGAATIGALTANQSVNQAQIAGTTTAVNAGNASAGTQRVVIATDQSAIPVSGTIAVSGTMPVSSAAASQVDGHSANIGALADASSASTLTGLLKNIKAALAGTLAVNNALPVQSATATLASVAGSVSSVTLQASNAARKGLVIVNDSTAILYVKFGTTASTTSYTYLLAGSVSGVPATLELPATAYTGRVDGIWASATGSARVTELT